jgi:hypothetical protein
MQRSARLSASASAHPHESSCPSPESQTTRL